jgi:hypothetical protein
MEEEGRNSPKSLKIDDRNEHPEDTKMQTNVAYFAKQLCTKVNNDGDASGK